jgi:uncharacterized membrane protein
MVRPAVPKGAVPSGTMWQDLRHCSLRGGCGRLISIGRQRAGLKEMIVMMFGYGYGSSWPVWEIAVMWIVMLAVVGLLAWGFYALASGASRRPGNKPGEETGGPGRILDERLARGEINADEYAQLREALASGSTQRADARSRA